MMIARVIYAGARRLSITAAYDLRPRVAITISAFAWCDTDRLTDSPYASSSRQVGQRRALDVGQGGLSPGLWERVIVANNDEARIL